MRFLIVSKVKYPIPPESGIPLLEALRGWAKQYTASKKIEQVWGFAGLLAGGGIINANSLEELSAIMMEFPLNMFNDTEIYSLIDMDQHARSSIEAIKKMMPPKS